MQSGTVVRAVSRRQVFSRHSPARGDASVSRLRLATEPLHQAAGSISSQLRNCSKQAIGGQGFLDKAVTRIKRLPRMHMIGRQPADEDYPYFWPELMSVGCHLKSIQF